MALIPLLRLGLQSFAATSLLSIPFLLILFKSVLDFRNLRKDLDHELACLETFSQEAGLLWARIRPLVSASLSPEDILSLVPTPTRENAHHSKFLIEEIANGKLYLIDTPSESVIRRHKEELETRLKELLGLGSLSVRLGILGTFIGFLLAILALSDLFSALSPLTSTTGAPNWGTWSGDIRVVLHDLAFKFVSSIYGLAVAILISIQANEANRLLNKFYRLFDGALSFGREFVGRMTLADPTIHSSLTQVRNALSGIEQRMLDHGQRINSALRSHGQILNNEVERFSQAAQGLSDVQKQWDTAFTKLSSMFGSLEEGSTRIAVSVQEGIAGASRALSTSLKSFKQAETRFDGSLGQFAANAKETEHNWQVRISHLGSQLEENTKSYSNGATALLEKLQVLHGNFDGLRNAMGSNVSTAVLLERLNILHSNLEAVRSALGSTIVSIDSSSQSQKVLADTIKGLTAVLGKAAISLNSKTSPGVSVAGAIAILIAVLIVGIFIGLAVLVGPQNIFTTLRDLLLKVRF